ncbi:cache domain-containing protein [Patescibacteria group bacterium]
MGVFTYEFIHFLVSVFAIVTCISSGALFFFTYRTERLIRNGWRALGFFLLATAFMLLILERKFGWIGIYALAVEIVAMFYIYRGVLAAPGLSHLAKKPGVIVGKDAKTCDLPENLQKKISVDNGDEVDLYSVSTTSAAMVSTVLVIAAVLAAAINTFLIRFINIGVPATFQLLTLVLALATIILQVSRLWRERYDRYTILLNIWPLAAYIFLLLRAGSIALYRLPDSDIVFVNNLTTPFSMTWQLGVLFTFLAFVFLGIWAWNFIKHRVFLRTYVIFLILSVAVAALGALIFTTLVFRIIENNNIELMTRGVETQEILMEDRNTIALFTARLISDDAEFMAEMMKGDRDAMTTRLSKYVDNTGADLLRVYSRFGEVIVSPTDPRDVGRVLNEDELVAYVITKKVQVRTFATEDGVLTSQILGRALHPLVHRGQLLGAVEVGYKFDNAFVDYSKEMTGLDVTIYSGSRRAATTIKTVDDVSRWIGSEESDHDVLAAVLRNGETFGTTTDRLGVTYYSAYKPVRHVNGDIIGMVAVGTPANILIEDTRQQLITIFLLVTLLALLAALVAYRAVFWFKKSKDAKGGKPMAKKAAKRSSK